MFNKVVTLSAITLASLLTVTSASAALFKSGEVIKVEANSALVYVGENVSNIQGKSLSASRLLPTESVLEGAPLFSYQTVGNVIVSSSAKDQHVSVKLTQGNLQKGDVLRLQN